MMTTVAQNTMRKNPVNTVGVDVEFGLQLGIVPGATLQLHTPGGSVVVTSERRAVNRAVCGAGGCNLPLNHPGVFHRGACGCACGCQAEGCPNL